MPSLASGDLRGVWGSGPTDVWGSDADAALLRFDGKAFALVYREIGAPGLLALWGSGPGDLWAAGSRAIRPSLEA